MTEADERWMAYIDAEVRTVCRERGWRHQIRCKWSQREKPVNERRIDDYEWKLITTGGVGPLEAEPRSFDEGIYYVLGFDGDSPRFILQHDTQHCGMAGPHWATNSYTEIHFVDPGVWSEYREGTLPPELAGPLHLDDGLRPATGWLAGHLLTLTKKYDPNYFSLT